MIAVCETLSPAPAQGDVAGLVRALVKTVLGIEAEPARDITALNRKTDAREAAIAAVISALTSTRGVGIEEAAADDNLKGLVEAAIADLEADGQFIAAQSVRDAFQQAASAAASKKDRLATTKEAGE